jgi:hypothetical protein
MLLNFILGMNIKRDCANRKLCLNQRNYVEKILRRFNLQESKLVKVHIPIGLKLSVDQCPKIQEEEEYMSHGPYSSVIQNLLYAMLCTRPYITHVVVVFE